jgi:hypothetical protein
MVTVVWDTWLKPGTEEEGLRLTRQVWSDMRSFAAMSRMKFTSIKMLQDTSSLSPSGGAARMRTVSRKNTRTARRFAGSPLSLPAPGIAG